MRKHQPALLGGLFIGVLSSLPVVNLANCCCLWVLAGGVLVVYLQQQSKPTPVETGDAVIGGLIAGVIGAVIASFGVLLLTNMGGGFQQAMHDAMAQNAEMPPQARQMMERFANPRALGILIFAFNIPVFAVFGSLGALLGLLFFRKKAVPQPPQPPPMSPTF
jgi:hypothetical protein